MTTQQRKWLLAWRGGPIERVAARLLWGAALRERFMEALDADVESGVVERLDVEVQRVLVAEEESDEGPILLCEVGEDRIVYLAGPWLYDPHIVKDDSDIVFEQSCFRDFSLVRAPTTGIVLQLGPRGSERIRAERYGGQEKIPFLGESAVLEGSLDNIGEVLRAHRPGKA